MTRRELLLNTPGSPGCRTLDCCCGHAGPLEQTFGHIVALLRSKGASWAVLDRYSFECTNFDGLSQIFASLTRERIAEREAAVHNLPRTRLKKTTPWPSADSANGSLRNQCSAFMQLPTKDARSMTKTSQVRCNVLSEGGSLSHGPRTNGTMPCDHSRVCTTIPEEVQWTMDKQ